MSTTPTSNSTMPDAGMGARDTPVPGWRSFYESGRFADLTIRSCDGTEFHVHQLIVYARSSFFAKAKDDDGSSDGPDPVIQLPWDQPVEAVRAMVEHMYHIPYAAPGSVGDQLSQHIKVYAIGAAYQMPGLQAAAAANFQRAVTAEASFGPAELVRAVNEIHAIVYLNADPTLCDILCAAILRERGSYARRIGGAPVFQGVVLAGLQDVGRFTRMLTRAIKGAGEPAELEGRMADGIQVKSEASDDDDY